MNANEKQTYTVPEAAEAIGVHPITVYRWLTKKHITGVRIGPKLWRIPRSEIERLQGTTQAK